MTTKLKGVRWWIAGVLCLATALNYLDRQTLALLAHTLETELGITTIQYSYIAATFLTSYTVMYAIGGRLIDYLGTRRGFALFVSFWSVADLLHAFARTVLQFSFCRFLLGAAEPANFPAAVKAVSEWFPIRERALAVGIFNSGTAIGAGLAAPLVAWMTLCLGWRYTFVAGAALSAGWVILWLSVYRLPRQHPWISQAELNLIEEGTRPEADVRTVPLGRILRVREAWGCILARLLTDPISYFFAFWMPQFLQRERGFDLADIGRYYWIPYMALAAGNIAGGAIPRALIQRGWSVNRSRKTVMFTASVVMPACFLLITRVPSPVWAVALISVAMFAHAAWANMTLPAEIFPKHVVGTVAGLGGAAGSAVGAVTMLLIGRTVVAASFTPIFIVYSIVPMTAFVLVCLLIKKLGQVQEISFA